MNQLNIVIAAEFELCEKIAQFLQQSELNIAKLAILEIYPFNEEQGIRFNQRAVAQLSAQQIEWQDYQYVLFAGDASQAQHMANAAEAGCVVIDIKGVAAGISGVPVIVPTVNDQFIDLAQRNIVSLPDPQVTQLALALSQLSDKASLDQVFVSSLLPASYHNSETVEKLAGQTARLLNGIPLEENEQRFAFDVFPQHSANLASQCQKIFPGLNVMFHAIQVPVFYGMAQKVTAVSAYELDVGVLTEAWQQHPWIEFEQNLITPVVNGEQETHQDEVKLHISSATAVENGVEFWSVADEQRFSLSFLAVALLEKLVAQH